MRDQVNSGLRAGGLADAEFFYSDRDRQETGGHKPSVGIYVDGSPCVECPLRERCAKFEIACNHYLAYVSRGSDEHSKPRTRPCKKWYARAMASDTADVREKYSDDFKLQVLEVIDSGQMNLLQAARAYGVGQSRIYVWRKMRQEGALSR